MKKARKTPPRPAAPIRPEYERLGPAGFYAAHGSAYRNPHEAVIHAAIADLAPLLDLSNVLDLAAGSGEATLVLRELGAKTIHGIDPYTGAAYTARTGLTCEALTFEEIAEGKLAGRRYSLVVCSFALHLLEESRLAGFCLALKEVAAQLLILTPHKRPVVEESWGWRLVEERRYAVGEMRCRGRVYSSGS